MGIDLPGPVGLKPVASRPEKCPDCGSVNFVRDGFYYPKDPLKPPIQIYQCNDCPHDFREEGPVLDYKNLSLKYILGYRSLESLIEWEKLPIRKSTLNDKIRLVTSRAPSGIQLSERIKRPGLWGHVLGFDLAYLPFGWKDNAKKERNFHYYIQCNDLSSKDRINYGLFHEKTAGAVGVYLAEIRDRLNYRPKLITIDLEDILIGASTTEFRGIPIQGCLVHLQRWLDKQLPTRKLRVRVEKAKGRPDRGQLALLSFTKPSRGLAIPISKDEERLWRWTDVKRLALAAAYSRDLQQKMSLICQLKALDDHGRDRVHHTIRDFEDRAKYYYHCKDELGKLGVTEYRLLTTNDCESSIKLMKALWNVHGGFKSPEAAKGYIDFFWEYVRTHKVREDLLVDGWKAIPRRRKQKQLVSTVGS